MAGTLDGGGGGGTAGASGGREGAADGDGTDGRGGSGEDGGSSGMCVRDQVSPSEVVFIGDSFIALGNNIPNALDANARAAGSLGQNESYRRNAVSGTLLGNGQIPTQYINAVNAGPVKVVLMDGGGNDCLHQNNPNPAYTAAVSLFQNMAKHNTEHVIYFYYPDPLGSYAGGTLQSCLDGLRPRMKSLCEGLTAPKCHFIDLRPGWKQADTTDGIHTTVEGGKVVADKVWATMQQNCIAQ
jgi:lysophospholipase L1-like esterase